MIARSDDSFAASAYMIQHAIDQAVARRDLRGMRIVRSDLLDMSRALSLDDQRDLKKLLEKHGRQDPYSEMAPDEESRRKRARRPRLPPDTDSG